MKIVIQRGDLIGRDDIVDIFQLLPARCGTKIECVVVYASDKSDLYIGYQDKSRQLSIDSPSNPTITKPDALKVVGVAILAISTYGDVPSRLKKSLTRELELQWEQLL